MIWYDMILEEGLNQQPCFFKLCHEALHSMFLCPRSLWISCWSLSNLQGVSQFFLMLACRNHAYYVFKSSIYRITMSPKSSLIWTKSWPNKKNWRRELTWPVDLTKIWSDLETAYGRLTPCKSILVQGSMTGTTAAEKNGASWVFQLEDVTDVDYWL